MAKHIALLSFICILISCTMRKPDNAYAQLIKGDWLGQKTNEGLEHDQTEFLCFEDSICLAPLMYETIKYEILNDTGGFSGKLSQREYNSIVESIRNLPLDSLRESYEAPWTDDQTKGVAIVYGDTVTRSAAYGHHKEPIELQMLFTKLMQLYKHVSLQPDSSVNDSYFSNRPNVKPEWFPFPPPPPPPPITPEMMDFTPPHS